MENEPQVLETLHKNIKKERRKTLKIRGKRELVPTSLIQPEPIKKSPKIDRLNERLIEVLEKLVKLMRKNRDFIRQTAYRRALETIQSIHYDIVDIDELAGKKYIGPTILEKFKEYVETGTLRILEREKEKPGYGLSALYDQFSQIYGVGPKKAQDLIDAGVVSMDDLRERQDQFLNASQKAGLKYYDDLLERIPRAEIDEYDRIFKAAVEKLDGASYQIVGSYRRGAPNSGDIDMILTAPDAAVFKTFVADITERGIILEKLSCGPSKCLVIAKLPGSQRARRVDFLYTPPGEYPFALLYFTGSKEFNTVMRGHALKWGLSLNEHGLYTKAPGQKKEEKVGARFETERDIFDALKLEYREPGERGSGEAVVSTEPPPAFLQRKTVKKREPKINVLEKMGSKPSPKTKKREPKIKAVKHTSPKESPKEKKGELVDQVLEKVDSKEKKGELVGQVLEKVDSKEKKGELVGQVLEKADSKEKRGELVGQVLEKPVKRTYKRREPNARDARIKRTYKKREPPLIAPGLEPAPILTYREPEKDTKLMVAVPKKRLTIKTRPPKKDIKTSGDIQEGMDPKILIATFKREGLSYIETVSDADLAKALTYANAQYYNTKSGPVLTDNEYDILKEYMERTYPENPVLQQIGAPIASTKAKVKLPYNMPSMDKIKPDTNALDTWTKKYPGPYVISCKLDGVSGLYVWAEGKGKLYTRGDGSVGQDITHLLKFLRLPEGKDGEKVVVRGEFIIPKKVFESKYAETFANARNLASGIINSKTIDAKVNDLHFVAYEVIEPAAIPSVQLAHVAQLGFEVVKYERMESITNESLSATLLDWRSSYDYEIDGIIVADDHIHIRKDGNPDYAFAFKMLMGDQLAEAKVVDVLWEASKSGYLKPRVRIEPVRLAGVTIEYATGFNGSFIEANKIGVGAIIQLVRSGDVIPHIKSVTTPAEVTKMPNVPYHWTDTHVDIILDNVGEDATVREKNITAFFVSLEVEGLSAGNVKRIIAAGFDSVPKILRMTKADFGIVEGFKQKMVDKLYEGIRTKVAGASLLQIMVASNVLGRGLGERKIRPILEAFPDILTSDRTAAQKQADLRSVPGIGPENARTFVANIPAFLAFLKECGLDEKLSKPAPTENKFEPAPIVAQIKDHALNGKRIVMTKVRDAAIIAKLKDVGATLDDTIGKQTFALIVKSKEDASNKTKYAVDHSIPIFTPAEFTAQYLV
jgi:NAD-dependent DNA ligase/DNA polymerase/3'-5' exonuclease PolX